MRWLCSLRALVPASVRVLACSFAALAIVALAIATPPLSFTATQAMAAPAASPAASAANPAGTTAMLPVRRPAAHPVKDVCPRARPGWAACASVVRTDVPKSLLTKGL
jgi:hypothetical protein